MRRCPLLYLSYDGYPMLTDAIVHRFAALFQGRTDVYGKLVVTPTGEEQVSTVHGHLDASHFRQHIEGELSIGVHPLLDDGTAYWLCVDIDRQIIDEAIRVKQALARYGIVSAIELSKRKGAHTWIFWRGGADAAHLRQLGRKILEEAGVDPRTELFPRQDRLQIGGVGGARWGNFVNTPYFGGAKRRRMLDDDLRELTLEEFVESAVQNDPALIRRVIPHPLPPEIERYQVLASEGNTPAYKGADPWCVRTAKQTPAAEGHRHNIGFRIAAYHLYTRQDDEETTMAVLQEWNGQNDPPLKDSELRSCISSVRGDHSCEYLRQEESFYDACVWERCNFYRREMPVISIDEIASPPSVAEVSDERAQEAAAEILVVERLCEVPFVREYVTWKRQSTDAPPIYHAMGALAAIAAAVGNGVRCRDFGHGRLFPHIWLTLIADSGWTRKSTALSGVRKLLQEHGGLDDRILPSNFTDESLRNNLSDTPCGLVVFDELAYFLKSMTKKYQAGTSEALTQLYNGDEIRVSRASSGNVVVPDPSITIIAASTKHWLQETLSVSDFASGFLARMLFVPGNVREKRRGLDTVERPTADDSEHAVSLGAALRQFHNYTGIIRFERVTQQYDTWDESMMNRWDLPSVPEEFKGLCARAGTLVRKFAMLLQIANSFADNAGTASWGMVTPEILSLAIFLVEWLIPRQVSLLTNDFTFTKEGRMRQRLEDFIRREGGTASRTAVSRFLDVGVRQLNDVLETAQESGYIEAVKVEADGGKGGRPATYYRLTKREA